MRNPATIAAALVLGAGCAPHHSVAPHPTDSRVQMAVPPKTTTAPEVTTTNAPTAVPVPQPVLAAEPETQTIEIPGTAHAIEFVRVPGANGAGDLWISRTEITWDVFDVFVYGLDTETGSGSADAVTRPSKPYIAMDRGFGHAGYPALSMSCHSAQEFCRWLEKKTGRAFRLPTEAEHRALCERSGIGDAPDEFAWYDANASRSTHSVATRSADALGLHDLAGNAAEWCLDDSGEPIVRGGSYLDGADAIGAHGRSTPTPAWNASDPQFPKSIWWLADAGFIGFRVIAE